MASKLKQIVVPSIECDYEALCGILQDTLEGLNYPTNTCAACGWISYSGDGSWEECSKCDTPICQACWDDAWFLVGDEDQEWPVLCQDCFEDQQGLATCHYCNQGEDNRFALGPLRQKTAFPGPRQCRLRGTLESKTPSSCLGCSIGICDRTACDGGNKCDFCR